MNEDLLDMTEEQLYDAHKMARKTRDNARREVINVEMRFRGIPSFDDEQEHEYIPYVPA